MNVIKIDEHRRQPTLIAQGRCTHRAGCGPPGPTHCPAPAEHPGTPMSARHIPVTLHRQVTPSSAASHRQAELLDALDGGDPEAFAAQIEGPHPRRDELTRCLRVTGHGRALRP